MSVIRRVFFARIGPELSSSAVLRPTFTGIGLFTFLAGTLYLPSLNPTRVEMIMVLLLLAILALVCTAVGQLTVIVERLAPAGRAGTGTDRAEGDPV